MKAVLAMDLGTTGNRVAAYSQDGKEIARSYREFPQIFPRPGWVEHNPETIWESTLACLKEVAAKVGPENITAAGITNQRETTVMWDKKTGKPVCNAIVWQCRRTAEMCRALKKDEKEIKSRTGLFVDPYFSATKIRWILDNVSGVREKAEKGDVLFGTVDTWILWKLTGGKVHATETSNASRTLCFNLKALDYDDELLKLFGVPRQILPQIRESAGDFGRIDAGWIGREVPVTGILGDQQASLFAQGGWEEGVVKNTYGTGLFVMTQTGGRIPESGRLVNTVAWTKNGKTTYALEGSIFVGGSAVQWLRDGLKIIGSSEETGKLAEELESNDGVYFVPALSGLGAPYWDPEARGLLIGLTRGTGPAHLARAALEAMAYQTRDVVEEMKKLVESHHFNRLRVDGGAVRNDWLMQFQADVLGFEVERPKITETTALGAAGIAGIHSGFWSDKEFLAIRRIDRSFAPAMSDADRGRVYEKWQRAVEKSLHWESGKNG